MFLRGSIKPYCNRVVEPLHFGFLQRSKHNVHNDSIWVGKQVEVTYINYFPFLKIQSGTRPVTKCGVHSHAALGHSNEWSVGSADDGEDMLVVMQYNIVSFGYFKQKLQKWKLYKKKFFR